jgi:hypothetical protein
MTGSVLVIAVIGVLIALVIAGALARRGGSGSTRKPRSEFLGAPPGEASQPLIRPESRHHDTPAGADLETPGGREHGAS